MAQKTREEIAALKKNWLDDSCYDLYTVEGFEEHAEELKRYQENVEDERKAARGKQVYQQARENLLDTFAAAALTGLLAGDRQDAIRIDLSAKQAYLLAEQMVVEHVERLLGDNA